jgi:hypothetical protein
MATDAHLPSFSFDDSLVLAAVQVGDIRDRRHVTMKNIARVLSFLITFAVVFPIALLVDRLGYRPFGSGVAGGLFVVGYNLCRRFFDRHFDYG